jgi:hypothetical protein
MPALLSGITVYSDCHPEGSEDAQRSSAVEGPVVPHSLPRMLKAGPSTPLQHPTKRKHRRSAATRFRSGRDDNLSGNFATSTIARRPLIGKLKPPSHLTLASIRKLASATIHEAQVE